MTEFRKIIDLISEAVDIDTNASPPSYEDKDADAYETLKTTGFFGKQAAGAILMAKTTGRIMLCLRSAAVLEPFSWGNCGGKRDEAERPVDAAKREVYEETGYTGEISMVPLLVFASGNFRYSNFLAIVEEEFKPHLGWEADRAVWVDFGHWPRPLHFGMEALFSDAESVNVIKHYAAMFSSLREDVNIDNALIAAGQLLKGEDLKDTAPEAKDGQDGQDGGPKTVGNPTKSTSKPEEKKSLSAIKPS